MSTSSRSSSEQSGSTVQYSQPDYEELRARQARRQFLAGCATGVGSLFLGSLAARSSLARPVGGMTGLDFRRSVASPLAPLPPQFPARARRVIYMHMVGAPSPLELFDHKPLLTRFNGTDCPAKYLAGTRAALGTPPKLLGSLYPFHQAGQSGAWMSDRFPHLEKHVDDLCFIKSMHSDQFNHAPGQLLVQTGNFRLGFPSIGSWVIYGLGTENQNLPGFIVLTSGPRMPDGGKQLWGPGFLPGIYQGIQCRSHGEPVLYLENPRDVTRAARRDMLDVISAINSATHEEFGNPETLTRTAQYEMAFRMQIDATGAMDIRREPPAVLARYGAKPGETAFANNCLMARRLVERGVRFIQMYHSEWDSHGGTEEGSLGKGFADTCREIDQPIAALLADLKSRGMLDDTLVVWGGEFGRKSTREARDSDPDLKLAGRDHNPHAFTVWLAGGGVKPGLTYGETDELGFWIEKNPVEVRDLHATILYLLGFDYRRLSFPYQGLDQKLTGVKPARVVGDILA